MIDVAPCKAKAGCCRRTLTTPYVTPRLLYIHITSQCGRLTDGIFPCWLTGRPPEGLLTWKLYLQSDGRSGYSDVTTSAVARHWHPFCRARHVAGPRCDNIAQTRPFS